MNKRGNVWILAIVGVVILIVSCSRSPETSVKEEPVIQVTPQNPISCDNLQNPVEENQCYIFLAMDSRDPSICGRVISQPTGGFSGEANVEIPVTKEEMEVACYRSVAEFTGDITICDRISNAYAKSACVAYAKIDSVKPSDFEETSGQTE